MGMVGREQSGKTSEKRWFCPTFKTEKELAKKDGGGCWFVCVWGGVSLWLMHESRAINTGVSVYPGFVTCMYIRVHL